MAVCDRLHTMRRTRLGRLAAVALAISLALSFCCCAHGQDAATVPVSQVMELTSTSFDAAVADRPVLVEIYANWCTHCRKFAPMYERVAAQLAQDGIAVAKVEGSVHSLISQRFKVKGFPSFFFVSKGRAWEFEGERTVEMLVKFARSGGEDAGKEMSGISEPFSVYWKIGGFVTEKLNQAVLFFRQKEISMPVVVGALLGICVVVLVLFALFINYATKPQQVRPKTQ